MIIFGKQPVLFLLQRYPQKIRKVFVAKDLQKDLFKKLSTLGLPIERLDFKKAQSLSKGRNHQGVLVEIDSFDFASYEQLSSWRKVVVLYNVSDVGNVGSIVRSAYALGMDGLILAGRTSTDIESIVRISSGAALSLPIVQEKMVFDLAQRLKGQGFCLIGATSNYKDREFASSACSKLALFLGSEDEGLSGRLTKKMDYLVGIDMKNNFDSLNVSAAGAILIDRMNAWTV